MVFENGRKANLIFIKKIYTKNVSMQLNMNTSNISLTVKIKTIRYYRAPNQRDMENEEKVRQIVAENIVAWQEQGLIPSMEIESGLETERLFKERGWTHWNHLFNARQLLTISLFVKYVLNSQNKVCNIVGLLGVNRCANYNSKLCRWLNSPSDEHGKDTFYNQALNPLANYSARALLDLKSSWQCVINPHFTKEMTLICV